MREPIAILERYSAGECSAKKDVSEERGKLIAARAAKCASGMVWLPSVKTSAHVSQRLEKLNQALEPVFTEIESGSSGCFDGDEHRWLRENIGLLRSALDSLEDAKLALTRTEYARYSDQVAPRVLVIAEDLLTSLEYQFNDSDFSSYMRAIQNTVVLRLDELWAMSPALQCVLLEQIAALANLVLGERTDIPRAAPGTRVTIETCIRSLREVDQAPWQELLEPLIVFDAVLRLDPAEAYANMDSESREMYRGVVVKLAKQSDLSEVEIAELALSLARESQRIPEDNPILARRRAHVGYYLIAEGRDALCQRAHVQFPFRERWQRFLRRYPNDFYLVGIEVLTLVMISAALMWVDFDSLWAVLFAALALLLPCSEAAVQIANYLISSWLQPQILPKLDFRKGIPNDCTTMVVVPTLLLDEKQVRQLVSDLEVRYLGNMSANLHFALLTDLPDSDEQPREDEAVVGLCGQLIKGLNEKYAGNGAGTFAMFHRHRVYNPREGVWMGWERKRGKLLDFNRLVLGQYDSFPYKMGDLSVLPKVRYVLTVDADTELPRGNAQRLVGTLAHPLCRAIIDRHNVVIQGYGILQPRVAVSFESAAESRLASIYSGRSGFDIYTHATSDVYQDLYGEGTFVGKGLYDLRTVHRVLEHRFPRNAILSHDLIEGAYARAGLVSDVEVVDRYPSHYSTYTRRKHRWVRGDWQIVEWLFPRVPDEAGRHVPNPISLISRWKIVDNLRRSMVGPATLVLFVLGWFVLPGSPLYWTIMSLCILLLPLCIQFGVSVARAVYTRSTARVGDACAELGSSLIGIFLLLAFLVHDALVSLDAAFRSSYRRAISLQRLLEWETAAEAEIGIGKRTSLDLYLVCTPLISIAIGAVLLLVRSSAFWIALPILLLWACSKALSVWLDQPPRHPQKKVSAEDKVFLRLAALRTWRYFAEFSTPAHHWLVPDCVQEEPARVAARVSPTNLGILLNARQIACEFGYLTVPEFVEQTRRTLETIAQLQQYRGHFFNWYDTRTLAPEPPCFISSVDSGNLAASLISLQAGCNALLEKPLLSTQLAEGYVDHLRLLGGEQQNSLPWFERLVALASEPVAQMTPPLAGSEPWLIHQLQERREQLKKLISDYMPWLLPEFESVRRSVGIEPGTDSMPSLSQLSDFVRQLQANLAAATPDPERNARKRLLALLPDVYERSCTLAQDLRTTATTAERWVAEMDFGFLLEPRRKLLSIGYHLETRTLDPACYDLLASEARIATFVAIGKGDVPQDTWFRLGRTHVPTSGGLPTLISWAGTMFEYLMPAIWMRSPDGTMLRQSMEGAVRVQKAYAVSKQIPWGISEAGYGVLDNSGVYGYAAMGAPELALRDELERLVIAPYASAMALAVAPTAALENLRRIAELGWLRAYGFYEAADFGATTSDRADDPLLVREWMAHHQGMILLSIGNLLFGNIVQQWFHADPHVRATDLLLDERPVLEHVRPVRHVTPRANLVRLPERNGNEPAMAS